MSSPDDCATFSAFVRKKNSVRAVDPGEKGNAVDPRHSYSAFGARPILHASSTVEVMTWRRETQALLKKMKPTRGQYPLRLGSYEGEETMKQVPLQHALTVPETTTIYEACCRMAAGKADALVLTDSNESLTGILTYKDIVKRVIARGIDFMGTPVSKVMTNNPIFVMSDAPCVEALEKMVQGEVKQLPVMEHGYWFYLPANMFIFGRQSGKDR